MKLNDIEIEDDPIKNADRLADIAELGLDSPEVDAELQCIATRAADELGLPIGVVSIVLDEAQWFVAMHGVEGWVAEAGGTPVEWSFCRNVVRSSAEFVVDNAIEHEIMQDSPLVQLEGLRCYAGIPLVSARGYVIGSFCVKGHEAREFSEEDMQKLRGFADDAMRRIESRRKVAAA
jgi:GAF domain-containing protein